MIYLLPIGGTWSYHTEQARAESWWQPDSAWRRFMTAQGFGFLDGGMDPFFWDSGLGGLVSLRRGGRLAAWCASGRSLDWWLQARCAGHPALASSNWGVVAHSHGGQLAFVAAAAGRSIPLLVTVGTPVRADLRATIDRARPQIGYWIHVYSNSRWWAHGADWTQGWGELFDGHLWWQRTFPQAVHGGRGINIGLRGVGHSDILYPGALERWRTEGLIDTIQAVLERAASVNAR